MRLNPVELTVKLLITQLKDNYMNNELITLIQSSFLNDKDKIELVGLLNSVGETDEFYHRFDELLADELSRRGEQYNDLVLAFDNEIVKLENEIEDRKAQADEALQKSLRKIDPFDIKQKTVIYESFYSTLENLENEHLDRLQKITAQYTMKAIN